MVCWPPVLVVVVILALSTPSSATGLSGQQMAARATSKAAQAPAGNKLHQGAAEARARFLEGDFAGALAATDAVALAFEQGPAWRDDDASWTAWADSRVTRALALRRLAREPEADEVLRALAVVRPTWSPDKSFVPPKVVARFEELRESLLAGPTVPLTVEVKGPRSAEGGGLVLDGRPAPNVGERGGVLDVLPGPHWVGVGGAGKKVNVTAPMDLTLTTPSASSASGAGDEVVQPGGGGVDEDQGPPWLVIGLGVAGVVVVAAVVAGVVAASAGGGATAVEVDASQLDADLDP